MKRNAVVVVIVIVVAVVAFVIGQNTAVAPKEEGKMEGERGQMLKSVEPRFAGAEKHEVAMAEAAKFIQNYQKKPRVPKIDGGSVNRGIIDKILAQPGCEGMRYYYAQNEDGSPTLVIVGVDSAGADMTAIACEAIKPCPPYCDFNSALLKRK